MLIFLYTISPAFSGETGGITITIIGEPIDPACYLTKGAKGIEHKACAEACNKAGQSLAILSNDGWLLFAIAGVPGTSPDSMLVPFIGTKIKVTGKLYESGGSKAIVIEKVEPMK
ncbi:MAG TPA: hypothetical protein VH878_01415 [Thermodesulfobacteriota bacterium]|jgi:hypothetical protein